jgi:hypothetical protein
MEILTKRDAPKRMVRSSNVMRNASGARSVRVLTLECGHKPAVPGCRDRKWVYCMDCLRVVNDRVNAVRRGLAAGLDAALKRKRR